MNNLKDTGNRPHFETLIPLIVEPDKTAVYRIVGAGNETSFIGAEV